MKKICTIVMTFCLLLALCACGKEEKSFYSAKNLASAYDSFEVSSDSLRNGKWVNKISFTDKGENLSPELSWEPVEGAKSYVVYMVDVNADYFMHWKAQVTETNLPLGWATKDYKGPYPPKGGKHIYEIYVVALNNDVERVKGALNSGNSKFQEFLDALDTDIDGNTGNIISCGYLSGTFKN